MVLADVYRADLLTKPSIGHITDAIASYLDIYKIAITKLSLDDENDAGSFDDDANISISITSISIALVLASGLAALILALALPSLALALPLVLP
jgi:hypothetical protein